MQMTSSLENSGEIIIIKNSISRESQDDDKLLQMKMHLEMVLSYRNDFQNFDHDYMNFLPELMIGHDKS